MIFLFPRWDMLVPWRVCTYIQNHMKSCITIAGTPYRPRLLLRGPLTKMHRHFSLGKLEDSFENALCGGDAACKMKFMRLDFFMG